MGIIVGIDIGGSTTKIVGLKGDNVLTPMLVKANDAITSLYGAFGKLISTNDLSLEDIEQIMITGVGSSHIKDKIYGLPTSKVDEFIAIGLGGLYLSQLKKAIIVSMGTGTAFIKANNGDIVHLGGTGIGGGTLLGLSNYMFNVRDFDSLIKMAEGGDITNIDLKIGDITNDTLTNLPPHTTASNFGKLSDLASKSDAALGLINMVFEAIAMQAIFASRIDNIDDIVLTGNLAISPLAWDTFSSLMEIFPQKFYLPQNANFATAFGAALAY